MPNINPTRMELMKQKNRLRLANHGHKLLKDKLDEMIRVFMNLLNEIQQERKVVDKYFSDLLENFILEKSNSYPEEINSLGLISYKKCVINDNVAYKVGIKMLDYRINFQDLSKGINCNFLHLSPGVFQVLNFTEKFLFHLFKLVSLESNLNILGEEIEKTRRRVNALEYRMIPESNKTIKFISNKIDENDREALVRIIKVKDNIKYK